MTYATSQTTQLRRTSVSLLTLIGVLYGLPAHAIEQTALPQGGNVASGTATLNYSATAPRLDINQSSQRAVIDWNSFNIGGNATTEFHQPTAGVAVNRVHDGSPSQILGNMKANGTVMVLNQNGVVFGENAKVDVGGLVASTGTIDAQKFMQDGTVQLSNLQTGGKVSNAGTITVADKGLAAFVAPDVANSGTITAKLGKIALAAGGDRATVDLYGDKLVELALDEKATKAIATNTGTLRADGGTVAMTASAVEGVVNNIVNAGGIIEANSVDTSGGRIVLTGNNVNVAVTGQLSAKGEGKQDGGVIAVKSNKNIWVSKQAKLNASAGKVGHGGTVDVVADNELRVAGTIKARGGSQQGDGGTVETSGHGRLVIDGTVDAGATNGKAGSWTIDPRDLIIEDTDTYDVSGDGSSDTPYASEDEGIFNFFYGPSYLDANTVRTALNANTSLYITTVGTTGPVLLPSVGFPGIYPFPGFPIFPGFYGQNGDIVINADLNVTGGNAATLNLNAAGSIYFGDLNTQGISSTAGLNLAFIANNDIFINRDITVQGAVGLTAGGDVHINGEVRTAGGNATIAGNQVLIGSDYTLPESGPIIFYLKAADIVTPSGTPGLIDAQGGDILITNSDTFSSSTADTLRTTGTGTITLNQYDTGSLQNAVDALYNTGTGLNRLNVKAGNYTEQLSLTQSNLLLQGDGRDVTTITAPMAMDESFSEGGLATKGVISAVNQSNITIDGLKIDGLNHGDDARVAGVAFLNTDGTVSNSTINNFNPVVADVQQGTGIYVVNKDGAARTFTATGNYILGFERTGVSLSGAGLSAMIADNGISGAGSDPLLTGIQAYSVDAVMLSGNTVNNVATGIVIGATDGAMVMGNTVTGATANGIFLFGGATNAMLDGNTVDGLGNNTTGIYADATSAGLSVTGNTVSNTTGSGIVIDGGATQVSVNTVTNTASGILINNSDGVMVSGNTVDQTTDTAIRLRNSADATVTGNMLGATFTGNGIDVGNSSGVVIDGNTVYNAQAIGITAMFSDEAQITNNNVTNGLMSVMVNGSQNVLVQDNTLTAATTGIMILGGSSGTTVDTNTIDGTGTGVTGIYADGSTANLTVTNNTLSNLTGSGIIVDGGAMLVDNNSVTATGRAIDIQNSTGVTVSNNTLDQLYDTGIRLRNSDFASVFGNQLGATFTNNGIDIETSNNVVVDSNNIINGTNVGIAIGYSDNVLVTNNSVTNGMEGILLNDTQSAFVQGNTVNAAGTGIMLVNNNGNTTIHGNTVDGQGTGITGIYADGSTTGLNVTNNTLSDLVGTGIDIDGGANTVQGNDIASVATGILVKNSAGVIIAENTLQQISDTAINVSASDSASVLGNSISNSTGNGIFMSDTASGNILGNNVDVGTNAITVAGLTESATINGNTITAASYGISVMDSNSVLVSDNNISGTSLAGIFTAGAVNGTITLVDNTVNSLNDGAHFASGFINLVGTNSFASANDGLVFDPLIGGNAGAGTLALGANTFGTTVLTGQAGYYIRLANGALFQPGAPTLLDASQVSFDGFVAGTNTLSAADAALIEPRLYDYDDDNTLGQIFITAATPVTPVTPVTPTPATLTVDTTTILPDEGIGRSFISRVGSVTITGLPYAPGAIPASVLAGLSTAAGGDGSTGGSGVGLSAEALNSLDSAAGGNTSASCWGDVYSHLGNNGSTTAVTFSLDSTPQALFNAQAKCGNSGV